MPANHLAAHAGTPVPRMDAPPTESHVEDGEAESLGLALLGVSVDAGPLTTTLDATALRASHDPANFPVTRALLDGSVVLFSQARPLLARSIEVVDRHADAFAEVSSRLARLVDSARESASQSEA